MVLGEYRGLCPVSGENSEVAKQIPFFSQVEGDSDRSLVAGILTPVGTHYHRYGPRKTSVSVTI